MTARTTYLGSTAPSALYTNERYSVTINDTRHDVRIATYANGSVATVIKYQDNYGEWWGLHPDEEQAKQVMSAVAADRDAAVAAYEAATVRR